MKKTRALLLTILLLTLAFVSCNIDGTTGIFRELAQSKAPLSIRYEQLLGNDATYLYFRTAKGVERVTTAKVNSPVVSSSYENIIQGAAFDSTYNHLLFITNNTAERANNEVRVVDPTLPVVASKPSIVVADVGAPAINSEFKVKFLYANSMILVSGKDGTGDLIFKLLKYDGATFSTSVAEFTMPSTTYDLYAVIQQTAKEQDTDASAQMIVSFVNADGDRIHYLVDPSGTPKIPLGTDKIQIANFFYVDANNIYILTKDGKIYHVDSAGPTWTLIGSNSKSYETNAFALAIKIGTKYHLITKPSSKTSALSVFTIENTTPTINIGSGVDVKSGYAKELSLATIVSAQIKTSSTALVTDLLVATEMNGMYDISITHAVANNDSDGNGTSSAAEGYSFP